MYLPIDQSILALTCTPLEKNEWETATKPFVHAVELKGQNGGTSSVEGLFDNGALVNSICKNTFRSLRNALGPLTPSSKILWMADGRQIPSDGS